jgi:hypothetical protein
MAHPPKPKYAIGSVSAWPGFCALALGSCVPAPDNATPCAPEDLLALAARHYRVHNPTEILHSGGRLSFSINDLDDYWGIGVGPADAAGGGTYMSIRKKDMHVEVSTIRGQ